MQEITILYWRDIPAQLIAGRGRKAIKYKLPEKYEKAIDRCAMKYGAKDSKTYLEGWRKFVFTTTSKAFLSLINGYVSMKSSFMPTSARV